MGLPQYYIASGKHTKNDMDNHHLKRVNQRIIGGHVPVCKVSKYHRDPQLLRLADRRIDGMTEDDVPTMVGGSKAVD